MRSLPLRHRFWRLSVIALILSGFFYWQYGLFPGSLKEKPQAYLEALTGFKIKFDRVRYLPFWGLEVSNVQVETPQEDELWTAEKIHLKTDLFSYLTDKNVNLPRITVKGLRSEIFLELPKTDSQDASVEVVSPEADFPWMLSEESLHFLAFMTPSVKDPKSNLNIFLKDIILRDAKLTLYKKHQDTPELIDVISNLDFQIDVQEKKSLPFFMRFTLGNRTVHAKARGTYNLSEGHFEVISEGVLQAVPQWAESFVVSKGAELDDIMSNFQLVAKHTTGSPVTYKLITRETQLEGTWKKKRFKGNLALELEGTYDPHSSQWITNLGSVAIRSGFLERLHPLLEHMNALQGSVSFDQKTISLESLEGKMDNMPFLLEGTFSRTNPRLASIKFSQDIPNLQGWKKRFPEYFENPLNLDSLDGSLKLIVTADGPLSEIKKHIKKVTLEVENGYLQPRGFTTPMKNINGHLFVENQAIQIHALSFLFSEEAFGLSGVFERQAEKASSLKLEHEAFTANAKFYRKGSKIEIASLDVVHGESLLSLAGTIQETSSLETNLSGEGFFKIQDLSQRWKKHWPFLEDLDPKGDITAKVILQGPLARLEDLSLSLRSNAPRLTLWDGYVFDHPEIDFSYQKGRLNISYARSDFYKGEIRARGEVYFPNTTKPLFKLHIFTQDTNLALISKHWDALNDKISGLLQLDLVLEGQYQEAESLTGHGNFRIFGGQLWRTPVFKELKQLSFLTIEGIDDLEFNQASGSFTIGDEHVHSEDWILSSRLIDIHVRGRIGFDRSLDLDVVSRFSSSLINESYEVGGLAPTMINIAENKITRYRITGVLEDPVYQPVS